MGRINRYAQNQLASSMVGTPGVDTSASTMAQTIQGGVDATAQLAAQQAGAIGQLGNLQLGLDRAANADMAKMVEQSIQSSNTYNKQLQQDIDQAGLLAAQTIQTMRYRQAQAAAAKDAAQKIIDHNTADLLGIELTRSGRVAVDNAQKYLDKPTKGLEEFRKNFEKNFVDIVENDKTLNERVRSLMISKYSSLYNQLDGEMMNWAQKQTLSNVYAGQDATVDKVAKDLSTVEVDVQMTDDGKPFIGNKTMEKLAASLQDIGNLRQSLDSTRGVYAADEYTKAAEEKAMEAFIRNVTNVNPTLAKTLLLQDGNVKSFFSSAKLDSLITNANAAINVQRSEEEYQFKLESNTNFMNLEQAEAAAFQLDEKSFKPMVDMAQRAYVFISNEYERVRTLPEHEKFRQRSYIKEVENKFKIISNRISQLNERAETAKAANITTQNQNEQNEYQAKQNKRQENQRSPESLNEYNDIKSGITMMFDKIDSNAKKYGSKEIAATRSGITVDQIKQLKDKLNNAYNKDLMTEEQYRDQNSRITELQNKITPDELKSTIDGKPYKPVKPVFDLFGVYTNYGVDLNSGATPSLYRAFGVKEGSPEARDLDTRVNKELRGLIDQNRDNIIDDNLTAQQVATFRQVAEMRVFKQGLASAVKLQERNIKKPVPQDKPKKAVNAPKPGVGKTYLIAPPEPPAIDTSNMTPEMRKVVLGE